MKRIFNIVNKVNNKDLISSLNKSLEHNDNALDYIVNKKHSINDLYKYTNDEKEKKELEIIEYIEFVLKFVGNQYSDKLMELKKNG